MAKVNFIPTGYHTVTPSLVCRNAKQAIEFYKQAFGATELGVMLTPTGGVMHAEILIGDSKVMLGDEMPQMGASSPQTLGGTPVSLNIYVENVDAVFQRAVSAGATAAMPPADMFWGDRYAKVVDPAGHLWGILTHQEDVSPADMEKRGQEAMAAMSKQ